MYSLLPYLRIYLTFKFLLLLAFFQFSIHPIAAQPATNPNQTKSDTRKKVCMVLDFDDKSIFETKIDVGAKASLSLNDSLIKSDVCEVIERRQLEKILDEQNISRNDNYNDPKLAAKIGKIFSADIVVTGMVAEFTVTKTSRGLFGIRTVDVSSKLGLLIQFIDVKTGNVLDSISVEGEVKKNNAFNGNQISSDIDDSIRSQLFTTVANEATTKIVKHLASLTATIRKISSTSPINNSNAVNVGKIAATTGKTVYISNISNIKNVSVGETLEIRRAVKEIKDPDTGEILSYDTQRICEIKVLEISAKIIIAEVISGGEIKKTDLVVRLTNENSTSENALTAESKRWEAIKNSSNKNDFEDFLREFPDGKFSASARIKLKLLNSVEPNNPNGTNPTTNPNTNPNINAQGEINLTRYPNISAQDEVLVAKEFAVSVSLISDKVSNTTEIKSVDEKVAIKSSNGLNLRLPATANRKWEIEVSLFAEGFTLKNYNNGGIIVLPSEGDSTEATFYLTAKPLKPGETERKARISAVLLFNNAFIAKIEREITVVANPSETRNSTVRNSKPNAGSPERSVMPINSSPAPQKLNADVDMINSQAENAQSPDSEASRQNVRFTIKQEPPDLTILIQEKINPKEKMDSTIQMFSPYFRGSKSGTFSSSNIPDDWLLKNYRIFSVASGRGTDITNLDDNVTTKQTLRGFGRELYDRLPDKFKEVFWELQNKPGVKIRSILIITNNPILPWELVCPVQKNKILPNDFLGAEYSIGRLHNKNGETIGDYQPQMAKVSGITVIAPKYQGGDELKSVITEVNNLKALKLFANSGGYEQYDGQIEKLIKLFSALPPRIIHFAGHGVVRRNAGRFEQSAIVLANGALLDSTTWQGMLEKFNTNQPLFFFNACEIGQSDRVAGFVDGWAAKVLEAGASGYIGALWSIGDRGASEFSTKFYQELEKDFRSKSRASVPDILRRVRQEFLKNNDPTFMSYIFYGDPNLILEENSSSN